MGKEQKVAQQLYAIKGKGQWCQMKHMTSNVQSKPLIALERRSKGPRSQPKGSTTTDPKEIDEIIRAAYGRNAMEMKRARRN